MKLPYSMEKNKTVIGLIIGGVVASYVLYTVFAVTTIAYSNGWKIATSGNNMTITYSDGRSIKIPKASMVDGKLEARLSPDAFGDECRKLAHVDSGGGYKYADHYVYSLDDGNMPPGSCIIKKITYNGTTGGTDKTEKFTFTDIAKLTEFAKSIGVK